MTLISISGLSAGFHGRDVVSDVSLQIGSGEFVALIGPNGAGKSTLLKAALGLIPSRGVVTLGGTPREALTGREQSRRVVYVPQDRDVAWPVSVEMVVGLGRVPHLPPFARAGDRDKTAIADALTRMDITHLRHRPATELSGGERARMLIARALAQDTPLLLTDEPTAGLDPAHQISLMQTFADLARDGRGVLACLHDLWLAARWCDRIVIIDEGRIIADGPPTDVLTRERLAAVYGITAHVGEVDGGLLILPTALSSPPQDATLGDTGTAS